MLQPTQTTELETTASQAVADAPEGVAADAASLTESDLLVEAVSIDGMCGVY